MEARAQVRRDDQQALVELPAQRDVVDRRRARVNRTIWICSGVIAGNLCAGSRKGNAGAINEVLTINVRAVGPS